MTRIIKSPYHGREIIDDALLNKGTAFSEEERDALKIRGLLPPDYESIEDQVKRSYEAFSGKDSDLEKHIYLRSLQDTNETLFYRLMEEYLSEMMPIIYTPVVGLACQNFSEIYRRPRGLFISYPDRHKMEDILRNWDHQDASVIVVTDGERILGLGDQGAGGMGIPIGKLSLYSLCGGIDPRQTLPILLDVGTNNEERLKDPMYIGWRHHRIVGDEYLEFVDLFVNTVKKIWPNILLQFEDFAFNHATPLLERYRDQLCMFNDDIQGTASVALGCILSAIQTKKENISKQKVMIVGAGSAGTGIAEQIIAAMVEDGITDEEARQRLYLIDSQGLIHSQSPDLAQFQKPLAQDFNKVKDWSSSSNELISSLDVIHHGKPNILIGVTGHAGVFTEEMIVDMAKYCPQPIIFPLSNPTSRMEAFPEDLLKWTKGEALIATGSPIACAEYRGKKYPISQCNNAYIFPAMGLAVLAAGITRISDSMFRAAARTLGSNSPALREQNGPLLPLLQDLRQLTMEIALAIAAKAVEEGHAKKQSKSELEQRIKAIHWDPVYPNIVAV